MKLGIKIALGFLITIGLAGGGLFAFTGFFVIQPIGAVPEGTVIWYQRSELDLPFIASADGLILSKGQEVSLFSRLAVLNKVIENLEGKVIQKLPYQEWMYSISTGGVSFEK